MKYFLWLFFLVTFYSFSQEKIINYSQAKIYYDSSLDFEVLTKAGIAMDHGLIKKNNYFESVFSDKEIRKARTLGYQVEISIPNMRKHVIEINKQAKNSQNATCTNQNVAIYTTPQHFELGSMGGFYTYDEMLAELNEMYSLYPNLITAKAQINNFLSFENRPFYFVKISDNPTVDENEPEMLFTAVHHAREPASMQQLIFYMWYLLENYATNDEVKNIVDHTEQFFIPILNVDGYIYNQTTNPNGGGFWRKNRRINDDGSIGVDNNRNYAYHWGEAGVSPNGNGETWPGTAPFSETENQAVKWFCEQHNFKMALNNHTYSGLLLYPYGYASNTPTPENNVFDTISELLVSENNYVNEIASALYPAAGDSDDWMYGDTSTKNKIYAMTPEIGHSFWPAQSEIIPICKDMMYHNLTAAHLITNYAILNDTSPLYVNTVSGNFNYSIKRLGLQEPANFMVSIIPISPNIISIGSVQSHNGMNLLQEDLGSISYQLAASIQTGDTISYKLVIDNGQFVDEQLITKYYGVSHGVFVDNGDTTSNYNGTEWSTSTAEYYSAPSSITDSTSGNYQDNINHTIELTNSIDLTNILSANLSFYAKWDIEQGWDYVQFEISIDNGATWIPQCGNYTKEGIAQQGIQGQPMYDGLQNNWVKEVINLSDYIGEQIKFRFKIVSDNYTTGDGFYFDDFKVEVLNNNLVNITDDELSNFKIYPNPFKENFVIEVPHLYNTAQLMIYNINGQLVYSTNLIQNLTTINLKELTNGIYFAKVSTDKFLKTVKIIKK